ncbi:helix-turn-helix domain-containing protein [Streptomyces echinatus]|uniref:Transcriptional regulator with XRE-family HTH domain n=1 Tax=Streptomyces echinatus TaxID=67293 RepID=A0A7W9Q3Z6_9ACTN|nr:helix-turn-helix transcriptional regulator [Streptomyces echinatus]MBB5932382.1 transcriptional regulator with XRE-family HTH domain [Streptomyces echinatus]
MDREREWNLSNWERLGRTFAAARRDKGLTQQEAADALHVSRAPIQAIERGRQSNGTDFSKVTRTMRDYARLVGWTADSPSRILDGEEPEPDVQPVPVQPEPAPSDLPPAVDRELRSGKTLDHTVVHMGSEEDDDTRIIVVLKGAEDISEEELDELWRKWRRTRRHLQAMPGETDAPTES